MDQPSAGSGPREPRGAPVIDPMEVVTEPRRCIRCAYDLRGLFKGGKCPECGSEVVLSLRENLLVNSAPEYVAGLHKGAFLVQASIITQILGVVVAILLMLAVSILRTPGSTQSLADVLLLGLGTLLSLAAEVAGLYGWWLLSTLDPRNEGNDRGDGPRKTVRVTVAISLGLAVVQLVVSVAQQLALSAPVPPGSAGMAVVNSSALIMVLGSLVGLLGYAVFAVKFFACMLYLRWLAPRLPDSRVSNRAKYMLWLGPILCTVGWFCLFLGPIVALVLYYNMLEWIRLDLKSIRARMGATPAAIPGAQPAN